MEERYTAMPPQTEWLNLTTEPGTLVQFLSGEIVRVIGYGMTGPIIQNITEEDLDTYRNQAATNCKNCKAVTHLEKCRGKHKKPYFLKEIEKEDRNGNM